MTTKQVEVNRPVREVYDQWTQFEEFPEFMEGVTAVHQESDSVLHWQADIGGQHREWRAKITRQEPDRLIAWESIDGARNCGVVTFEPAGPSCTLVSLDLDFEPQGLMEQAADKLGVVQRKAVGDLDRFKHFIETRGSATGAWRGQIEGGQVTKPSSSERRPAVAPRALLGQDGYRTHMATLIEYARSEFPNHDLIPGVIESRTARSQELTAHTVIVHVVGQPRGTALTQRIRRLADGHLVADVIVFPHAPDVVPKAPEDKDGIFDLPKRRVVSAAAIGALIAGFAALLAALLLEVNVGATIVLTVFFAVLGGGLGFLIGGGGRYAGERAWTQPQAAGEPITVIAAYLDDEAQARAIAQDIELADPVTVRIVDRVGRWHLPNT